MSDDNFNFIHKLRIPTGIFTFDGDVVDVNDLMIFESKATDKAAFSQINCREQFVDKIKHDQIIDTISEGKEIRNQRNILKGVSSKTLISVSSNVKLFSLENKMYISQNLSDHSTRYLHNRMKFLMTELHSIHPYLNSAGLKILNSIIFSGDLNYSINSTSIFYKKLENLNLNALKLTKIELTICMYLSLPLSNSEINIITGITINAIRVNIHRICQKLKLENRDELELYLKTI